MHREFHSADDFRISLERRLKRIAEEKKIELQRIRRQLAFDRFLSRIFFAYPDQFCLKGGYAMELVFSNARTTKDIDLVALKKTNQHFASLEVYQILRDVVEIDLEDYFSFKPGLYEKPLVERKRGR